ncbi:UNVERIFIED_CONTAM: hypothetical protein GTU68_027956 [Idotea baltica]|nr:hypothetical protein [Idotea baltica]
MALGQAINSEFRLALSRSLRAGSPQQTVLQDCLITQSEIEFTLPCQIGDYTDFYSSIHHATAVGVLFRPEQPLLPNYQWVPIGYHGRSSSINISGTNFHRPYGQIKSNENDKPDFGPSKRLDYELELGIYVGQGSEQGEQIDIESAEQYIFGLCLFNDWSARDIQAWEYQPLGPFLGKNFASTISPWIITTEALAPFRVEFNRPATDPQPLDYLSSEFNSQYGAIDIQLECSVETAQMRHDGEQPSKISSSSFKHCYWTPAQMVTHHTVNGCNLQSGDLLGTGTQSGPSPDEAGSLLEMSEGGKTKITLANGEQRTFLEDGDAVIMRAYCEKPGATKIGFGEVVAQVLPALSV